MLPDKTVIPAALTSANRAFGAIMDPEFNYGALAYAPKSCAEGLGGAPADDAVRPRWWCPSAPTTASAPPSTDRLAFSRPTLPAAASGRPLAFQEPPCASSPATPSTSRTRSRNTAATSSSSRPAREIDIADVFAAELLRDGHAIIPASPAPAPSPGPALGEAGPAHTIDTTDEAA